MPNIKKDNIKTAVNAYFSQIKPPRVEEEKVRSMLDLEVY